MSIFSIQKFSQNIPNFDTLERVWQSLFKVYNQTLRQMGDNDFFSVEHTGVRVRQMAGTLERVVKYDAVAFQKACWDFLASSDDEDNYWGGRATVFAAVGPCRVMSLEKKKEKVSTKKTSKISKKSSPRASDPARARINITPQTYGTEEVST